MAYNQNFPANAYQPNLTSYPLLRPADVNPPVPPSISGPGPDRFAPRRGGYRGARGGPSNPRNALSSNRGGSTEGQRMQDDPSRFSDRSEGRDPGYGGASGYSNIEIGPNNTLDSGIPYAARTERRDPLTHKKLIGDRIQRERPCRTLFVRNVSYAADSSEVLRSFEAFGDIKHNFDLVSNRGMLFVTYYDSRAAERAKEAMHSTSVMNRPIDVHYSLPRADEVSGICDREKNQGTLRLGLVNGLEANPVLVRRVFSGFGDIKELRPGLIAGTALLEYFDSRAAVTAWDKMQDKPFDNSRLALHFEWDATDDAKSSDPAPGASQQRDTRSFSASNSSVPKSPNLNRPGPYDRPGPPNQPAKGGVDRLHDAKKIQDLLASLGNISSPGGSSSRATPQSNNWKPPNDPPARGPPFAGANAQPITHRTHPDRAFNARSSGQNQESINRDPRFAPSPSSATRQNIPPASVINSAPRGLPPNILATMQSMSNIQGPHGLLPATTPAVTPYNLPHPIPPGPTRPIASNFGAPPPASLPQFPAATSNPSGNGNTTQAMTQLLALLVAQQQK